jgi:hypothetical protein
MAVFGFEHGGSRRYATAIEKLFQIESADAPLPPGFILEVDRPEWHSLYSQRDWDGPRTSQIGDATHFAQVEIFNPVGSNTLVVVTGWDVEAGANGLLLVILDGTASGGGITAPILADTRLKGAAVAQLTSGKPDLAIGAQQVIAEIGTGANALANFVHKNPVILAPGHRVKVEHSLVNINIAVTPHGYERPATPDELVAR